jgi:hypothetical protein
MVLGKNVRIIFTQALLITITSTNASGGNPSMDMPRELLNKIDGLANGHPLSSARVAKHLNTTLRPAADRSTEHTLIYVGEGDDHGIFEDVELRVPTSARPNGSQLLILTPSSASCVKEAGIIERYGRGELSLPTPRQPPDSPVYRVFPKPWGKLSFGIARDGSACLRKVVIDVQAAAERELKR